MITKVRPKTPPKELKKTSFRPDHGPDREKSLAFKKYPPYPKPYPPPSGEGRDKKWA
jgi:hypothetical protein